MPEYLAPGVYVEEVSIGARPIEAVGTSTAGFLGEAPDPEAHLGEAVAINNWGQFDKEFIGEHHQSTPLSHAVLGFFLNGGSRCYVVNVGAGGSIAGGGATRSGLDFLEPIDELAIIAAPGYTDLASHEALIAHCERLGDRVAILDAAEDATVESLTQVATVEPGEDAGGGRPRPSSYAALYYPWIIVRDPFSGELVNVAPSGYLAGVWARTDATRGVHKAPANVAPRGALGLVYGLTQGELELLSPLGINCLRAFSGRGIRVWGARTLDESSSEWRYLNVRRLFNMIEESIEQGTQWVVFEPNDISLWQRIRRDVRAFLTRLWRDGALMGRTPEEAFFVKCDEETNPPEEIDAGVVTIEVGIAPVKPAEFVVFRVSQWQGGTATESEGGA